MRTRPFHAQSEVYHPLLTYSEGLPVDLDKYAASAGQTATIDLGDGQTFDIKYNSAAATPKFFRSISGASKSVESGDLAGSLDAMVNIICGLVISWPLKSKGKVIPLTPAGVEDVPMPVLEAIVEAIFSDQDPGNA